MEIINIFNDNGKTLQQMLEQILIDYYFKTYNYNNYNNK